MQAIVLPVLSIAGWPAAAMPIWWWRHQRHAQRPYGNWGKEMVVFGPLLILSLVAKMMGEWGPPLYLTRSDRKNPFRDDLRDTIRQYRLIHHVPGESAEKAREELMEVMIELRLWPEKVKLYQGDQFIAALKSETARIVELSQARLQAYEGLEKEALAEIEQHSSFCPALAANPPK